MEGRRRSLRTMLTEAEDTQLLASDMRAVRVFAGRDLTGEHELRFPLPDSVGAR